MNKEINYQESDDSKKAKEDLAELLGEKISDDPKQVEKKKNQINNVLDEPLEIIEDTCELSKSRETDDKAEEKTKKDPNKIFGVEVDIIKGPEMVREVQDKLEAMKKSGELEYFQKMMADRFGLNEKITPEQEKLLNEYERTDEKNKIALENIEQRQKEPVIKKIERGELTNEEKIVILEKLKGYLSNLDKKTGGYTKEGQNIKNEIEKAKKMIEKLEKDLKEYMKLLNKKIQSNAMEKLIIPETEELREELEILGNMRVILKDTAEIGALKAKIKNRKFQ
ncbi:MAG: hypothetical protein KAS78_05025 [Candidatus Pacebacteria bacterium]|nr:hypothetical protein [Candidatus Paceibacterota bacterium]